MNRSSIPRRFMLLEKWDTFRDKAGQVFETLLRSTGLFLVIALNRIEGEEQPKVLIRRSPWHLAAHCTVHILPATVSAAIVGINLRGGGYFIGSELDGRQNFADNQKMGFLQVAAKVQELLIIASLSTVIFHLIHTMLVTGRGVPLGLIASGSAFSQASYFWSTEFWGGVASQQWPKRRWDNIFLIVLLVASGLMSLFVGPATAILMIPRSLDWHVGGGPLWVNGSHADLWPVTLNAELTGDYNCSDETQQLYDAACPSAGYVPLSQYFSSRGLKRSRSYLSFEIQDQSIHKTVNGYCDDSENLDTRAWTPHAATALHQDTMRAKYKRLLDYLQATHPNQPPYPLRLNWAAKMSFDVQTRVPRVRASVMTNWTLDLSVESLTTGPVLMPFPVRDEMGEIPRMNGTGYKTQGLPGQASTPVHYSSIGIDTSEAILRTLIQRGVMKNSQDGSPRLVVGDRMAPSIIAVPIELPQPDFHRSEFGIVFLVKRTAEGNNHSVITCTVNSEWVAGRSFILADDHINRGDYHDSDVSHVDVDIGVSMEHTVHLDTIDIHIEPSWFDLLTPVLDDSTILDADLTGNETVGNLSPPRSLLERLIEPIVKIQPDYPTPRDKGLDDDNYSSQDFITGTTVVRTYELIIATFFADGISRCGFHMQKQHDGVSSIYDQIIDDQLDKSPDKETVYREYVYAGDAASAGRRSRSPPPRSVNGSATTMLVMSAIFTGYVMAAKDAFDYIWVVVLSIHIIVVIGYAIWVIFWSPGLISAWDTTPSMLALAYNSIPDRRDDDDGEGEEDTDTALKSTCAGVRAFRTLGQVAVVEKTVYGPRDGGGGEEEEDGSSRSNKTSDGGGVTVLGTEELRLVFRTTTSAHHHRHESHPRPEQRLPSVGTEYGALGVSKV